MWCEARAKSGERRGQARTFKVKQKLAFKKENKSLDSKEILYSKV